MIHQFDPHMAPDADFVPGTLAHLVPGNEGRMLDRRRTPVRVGALRHEVGVWTCEVRGFEDAGARWELPFEHVDRFQFAKGSPIASDAEQRRMRTVARRLGKPLAVPLVKRARLGTARRIAALRLEVRAWLSRRSRWLVGGSTLDLAARTGDSVLWRDLEAFLRERELWEIEARFTSTFVSNPASGEVVKGHEFVLAQLGLADFNGEAIRDPAIFEPPTTIDARQAHLLTRLAFVREVFAAAGLTALTLYRGVWSETPLTVRPRGALISATTSLQVATSLFGTAAHGGHAALYRQRVPVERVLMTYLETAALNGRFQEAEVVLIEDPGNVAF